MAKVLVLFLQSDEQESKRLRDCLQTRLGTKANVEIVKEAIADGSNFKTELTQSRCVILVSSKQSSEYIKQGEVEKQGNHVLFDGKFIQQQLKSGDLLKKLVVVQFGSRVVPEYVPEGYDPKEVFLLPDNFNPTNPVLDQIEDKVKGFLTSKVKENERKEKKSCNLQ